MQTYTTMYGITRVRQSTSKRMNEPNETTDYSKYARCMIRNVMWTKEEAAEKHARAQPVKCKREQ